ncbi:hypothetical protein [Methylobacillus sp.]|uniref:hypothetical protein n=1 Tax=Methylobacillus sp. TaxID=56818 RepID=UPI002FDFE310
MKTHMYQMDYLNKAGELSEKKTERLLSRMGAQLHAQLVNEGYSLREILAIQLQIEDEQLKEWRARMMQVRQQELQWQGREIPVAEQIFVN